MPWETAVLIWNPHNVLKQLCSERLLLQLELQPCAGDSFLSPDHLPIPCYFNSEKLTAEILHQEWEELLCQHPRKNQHSLHPGRKDNKPQPVPYVTEIKENSCPFPKGLNVLARRMGRKKNGKGRPKTFEFWSLKQLWKGKGHVKSLKTTNQAPCQTLCLLKALDQCWSGIIWI